MPMTPSDAELALQDIAQTAHSSARLYGYRRASPHLILWGVIWVIGYGKDFFLGNSPLAWPLLTLLGALGSAWLVWRMARDGAEQGAWRYGATAFAVCLFIGSTFAILPPRTSAQISAFFPMLVALFYSLVGIWTRGLRMVVAGAVIAALTLAGYFMFPQIFLAWMALLGGGALIVGGFWLRTA
jgi:hypothetical protein